MFGKRSPRRPPAQKPSRVRSYLTALTRVLVFLLLAASALTFVQEVWHPFDAYVEQANVQLALLDQTLDSDVAAGISLSAIVLVLAVAGLSLAARGVRKRQYLVSFWRGLLSSAIFLASDAFYRFVRELGQVYFTTALALFIVAILILAEVMARWGNHAEERERRTEYLASIVSGLTFALIVQAGQFVWSFLSERVYLPF